MSIPLAEGSHLEPYIHGFDDLELQHRIEALWEDFLLD
jgi:hypothetical protein